MKVLVVGSGGREHALAWKIAQSARLSKLYVAPGNGGTEGVGENITIDAMDFGNLATFAEEKKIDLTVVGPENPLGGGIVDVFQKRGLRIFGPTKVAAQIESSKAFSKQLMRDAGIPTAEFVVCTEYEQARTYVHEKGAPIVIKVDGLVLGKGAYVCMTMEGAEIALKEIMLDNVHKNLLPTVVIEQYLDGQEISIHAFSDGKTSIMFPPLQDHKTIGEGDIGKMTGGMGVVGPLAWVSSNILLDIDNRIVQPTLKALRDRGTPFAGVLYPGLKMTSQGPKVLEFNGRFGNPETEVYMRLLKNDLLDVLEACVEGNLASQHIEWNPGFAACVMIASGGYPDTYEKGFPISGIEEAGTVSGVTVFHAGTRRNGKQVLTDGGRVLSVTAIGTTLKEVLDSAYLACDLIQFKGKYFRRDIGAKAL